MNQNFVQGDAGDLFQTDIQFAPVNLVVTGGDGVLLVEGFEEWPTGGPPAHWGIEAPAYSVSSIDVEGYVWIVDQGVNQAFKIDPDTYQVQLTVSGLMQPYTYSDMTGAGLNLVVNPPAG